jgi:predicted transcriptional regulator of viral defense system
MGAEYRTSHQKRYPSDIRELARRQHGLIALRQAVELGFTAAALSRRVRSGALDRVFPRTYRIAGAPPSPEQRALAAILWAGPKAVASHATAAHLWRLLAKPPAAVHVTTPAQLTRPPSGIVVHTAQLRRDRGRLRGVPITSVARTLLDLAATSGDIAPLVERSVLDDLVTVRQLIDILDRNCGRRGVAVLRAGTRRRRGGHVGARARDRPHPPGLRAPAARP